MAKIVLPTTSPVIREESRRPAPVAPDPQEFVGAGLEELGGKLMDFALKESERQDRLLLTKNPLKNILVDVQRENFDGTVYNEDGSVDFEQSLMKTQNIIDSSDALYEKSKLEAISQVEQMPFQSRAVQEEALARVTGQFTDDPEQIKRSLFAQADALKSQYIATLKSDFLFDPDANIEDSLSQMFSLAESMSDSAGEVAGLKQFSAQYVNQKAGELSGAYQIINGFENSSLEYLAETNKEKAFSTVNKSLSLDPDNVLGLETDLVPVDVDNLDLLQDKIALMPEGADRNRLASLYGVVNARAATQESYREVIGLLQGSLDRELAADSTALQVNVNTTKLDQYAQSMNLYSSMDTFTFNNFVKYFKGKTEVPPKYFLAKLEQEILKPTLSDSEQEIFKNLGNKFNGHLSDQAKNKISNLRQFGTVELGQVVSPPLVSPENQAVTFADSGFSDLTEDEMMRRIGAEEGWSWFNIGRTMPASDRAFATQQINVLMERAYNESYLESPTNAPPVENQVISRATELFQNTFSVVEVHGVERIFPIPEKEMISEDGTTIEKEEVLKHAEDKLLYETGTEGDTIEDRREEVKDILNTWGIRRIDQNQFQFIDPQEGSSKLITIDMNAVFSESPQSYNFYNTGDAMAMADVDSNSVYENQIVLESCGLPDTPEQFSASVVWESDARFASEDELNSLVESYPLADQARSITESEFFKGLSAEKKVEILSQHQNLMKSASKADPFLVNGYTRDLFLKTLDQQIHETLNPQRPGFIVEIAGGFKDLYLETFTVPYKMWKQWPKSWEEDPPKQQPKINKKDEMIQDLLVNPVKVPVGTGVGGGASHLLNSPVGEYYEVALNRAKEIYQDQVNSMSEEELKVFIDTKIIPAKLGIEDLGIEDFGVQSLFKSHIEGPSNPDYVLNQALQLKNQRNKESSSNSDINSPTNIQPYIYLADHSNLEIARKLDRPLTKEDNSFLSQHSSGKELFEFAKSKQESMSDEMVEDILRFSVAQFYTNDSIEQQSIFAMPSGRFMKFLDALTRKGPVQPPIQSREDFITP